MPRGFQTPWRAAVEQILSDGKWHDREEIVTAALPSIPPGIALRYRASRLRGKAAAEKRKNWDVRNVPIDRKIYYGRRSLIMQALSNLEVKGVIVVDRERNAYQIRVHAVAGSSGEDSERRRVAST